MGPAGTKIAGTWPKLAAAMTRPGHDLVADAEVERGVEGVVRQRHARGERDHVAEKSDSSMPALDLGHAVAHRRHDAGDLGGAAVRLMRP
jgi:hypothetical protein